MSDPAPVWAAAPRLAPDVAWPAYAFVPGVDPHPIRDPRGHSFGAPEPAWSDERAVRVGVDRYHAGYLWEAHEAWEQVWKRTAAGARREFLRALIQLAAALLKRRMGDERGVAKLAAKAATGFAGAGTPGARDLYVAALRVRSGGPPPRLPWPL